MELKWKQNETITTEMQEKNLETKVKFRASHEISVDGKKQVQLYWYVPLSGSYFMQDLIVAKIY